MMNWSRRIVTARRIMALAASTVCGCSDGTEPRDAHAGTYGAVLWTSEYHGLAPSDNLDVDGASYTIWLEHDGHARRRIIVPGGQGGQAYDEQLSGTWRLGQSDSLIVTLILQGVDIEGGTV